MRQGTLLSAEWFAMHILHNAHVGDSQRNQHIGRYTGLFCEAPSSAWLLWLTCVEQQSRPHASSPPPLILLHEVIQLHVRHSGDDNPCTQLHIISTKTRCHGA
jgi:hypothetical protein